MVYAANLPIPQGAQALARALCFMAFLERRFNVWKQKNRNNHRKESVA
jgi:hypothetical protein